MALLEEMAFSASRADANRCRIAGAFVKLLEDASYEEVSIGDLCRESGLSRPTFYRYFPSKHEVAPWFWDQIAHRYLLRVGTEYTWYESFLHNFQVSLPYLPFFEKTLCAEAFDSLIKHAIEHRRKALIQVLEEEIGYEMTAQLLFEIDFFVHAETHVRLNEVDDGGLPTPEEKAAALTACVPDTLRRVVDEHVMAHRGAIAEQNKDPQGAASSHFAP